MKHPRFLLIALVLASVFGLASERSQVTHEQIWLMPRVGAPVPSPDGRWVVFSVTEPSYNAAEQRTDLWLAPVDGSAAPRRITFTKSAEGGVDWSPDSSSLIFTARRDGDEQPQVYLLPLREGGEAIRLTSISTGAAAPAFSPDGKKILFETAVYPGAATDEENRKIAEDRKKRKYEARVYTSFPIRYWDRWLDDRVTHILVQEAVPGAQAKDLLAGTKLAATPGFGGALSTSGESLRPVWTPDGKAIVFSATTQRNAAAYSEPSFHLYLAPVEGGEPQRLTQGEVEDSNPRFAPNGKALYFTRTVQSQKVYHLERLMRMRWPEWGEPELLTGSFDRAVGRFAISPDSASIYIQSEEAGREKIFKMPASGGVPRLLFEPPGGTYGGLAVPAKAGRTLLLANWESAVHPPEVVRIEEDSSRHVLLSQFCAERAARLDWAPLREFWFTSRSGRRIHNFLALPPGFDENRKYPLVVLIHGGPHSAWVDRFFLRWNYHLIARPGFVVLMTDYKGSTGYGEEFAQAIQGDPLKGPAEEINEAADEAIRRFPFIDGSRQAAGGASYGGHLANWLQATTTRYKCLFSHAGLINLESQWGTSDTIYHRERNSGGPPWEQGPVWREQNPIRYAAQFRTPMLLTVGENDFRVPLNQTLENWSVLQRLRISSRLIVFPRANHWIQSGEDSRFFYQELEQWLVEHLKP